MNFCEWISKYKVELFIALCILLLSISTFLFSYYYLSSGIPIYTKTPIETKINILTKPLYEFIICSSHNSYLRGIQHGSPVRTITLKRVLEYGARSIELDIHKHTDGTPIVAHGSKDLITTGYVPLEKMVDVIVEYGFRTSDPLFLFCEILHPEDREFNEKIRKIFIDKLSSKISFPDGSIDPDNFISTHPIQLFLNKLILFGTMDKHKVLSDIFYPSSNILNMDHKDIRGYQPKQSKQISRIYKREGLGSVFSLNIDPTPFWKLGHTMVTMDFQTQDENLKKYMDVFRSYSFIHISELG